MPSWLIIGASTLLAVVPVGIWLSIIRSEGEDRSLYVKTFIIGTLSVVPPFILIFLFDAYPQLNIYSIIRRGIEAAALMALVTNIVVAIVEEIGKNVIVRVIDKRHPEHVQTLTSALKLSICAGLGFSFAENIFYFYNIWTNPFYGYQDLIATFIFRSIITMCGHMVFSGIFGYYFGIGKFAADITEQARWEGKSMFFVRLIGRITGKMPFEVVRELKNLKGLLIAIAMHASFNASLDLNHKLPSLLIVIFGAIYIWYLMKRRTGHMLFSVVKRRASSMAAKDEEVVLELLGMWLKEGKLKDVISICDRLLQRDPDNNVVKLFRAKAADDAKMKQVFSSLKAVFEKQKQPAAPATNTTQTPMMKMEDEKVVLELLGTWFQEGKYADVLNVSKRLISRNPNSTGARMLMEKALDKEKVERVFDSLSQLFAEK